jgi:hypothetical protein
MRTLRKQPPLVALSICDRGRLVQISSVIGKNADGLANKAHGLTAWETL